MAVLIITKVPGKKSKGTKEEPVTNVRAKSGLNSSILDQGWHAFKTFLDYKLKWAGGELILVDPKYKSQKCSRWGTETSTIARASQILCVGHVGIQRMQIFMQHAKF